MRNKEEFINDAYEVVKDEFKTDLNVVEDAAHLMHNNHSLVYTIPSEFTTTGKNEKFYFEKKLRPTTDDPEKSVEDYFYIKKGE